MNSASVSQLALDEQHAEENMANLMILKDLRDFPQENGVKLKEIEEETNKTDHRIDQTEKRITETEERIQTVEEAVLGLLKVQSHLEARLIDWEGQSRWDNMNTWHLRGSLR